MKANAQLKIFPIFLLLFLTAWTAVPAEAIAPGDLLIPGGEAVGILLESDGVIVSGLAEIQVDSGSVSPAKDAGLRSGDRIVSVNGQAVRTGEDFLTLAAGMDGSPIRLEIRRCNEPDELVICPVQDEQGEWKLGLWLRSGVNGLGTVTFWDPSSGLYGALGHGVSLPEDETRLAISGGKITAARVTDVVPGQPGEPGELCGLPEADRILGTVEKNTGAGIFGHGGNNLNQRNALPMAAESEITTGDATILSTVDNAGVKEYDAEILRITHGGGDPRQMTISITDPTLLSVTGGIVQGMSGSPILQNGKLVGAVTHVLVSDPTKGYGISIENMLQAAA